MRPHWYVMIPILGAAMIAGCRAGAQPASPSDPGPGEEPTVEGMERLEPTLPTGVHLQAVYQIPPELEGFQMVHREMNYLLYLPESYGQEPDRLWPTIIFLHGAGAEIYDSAFVMSFGLPAVLLAGEQPEDFPFIVVSPQAFDGGSWWSEDTVQALSGLLDEVINSYRVDPDRVYLTGLSMGGYGSWYLATAYPDRFAAMVSISGSGYRTPYLPEEDVVCRMRDLPVWAIHGAHDAISDPEASRLNAMALKSICDGEVEWTLYPDEGHIGAYERAYRDPALFDWMLKHSR